MPHQAWQSGVDPTVDSSSPRGPTSGVRSFQLSQCTVRAAISGSKACGTDTVGRRRGPGGADEQRPRDDRRRRIDRRGHVGMVAVVGAVSPVSVPPSAVSMDRPCLLTQTGTGRRGGPGESGSLMRSVSSSARSRVCSVNYIPTAVMFYVGTCTVLPSCRPESHATRIEKCGAILQEYADRPCTW